MCEPTGITYTVRREYYPHTSPAGKGAKWEWAGDGPDPEWHIYDMEVQTVIEDAWTLGKQVTYLTACKTFYIQSVQHGFKYSGYSINGRSLIEYYVFR